MSKADQIFIENMKDIMENGFWDTELNVRPHWEDGTPAHTVKKFCIVNRYNLQEELCNAGNPGSIPGLGRSSGEGNVNPLQYTCLETPMDRGAWCDVVHGVTKSQTRLSD